MASVFARTPVLITATAVAVAGTAFYFSLPAPTRLDSAYNEVSRALSFPRNMLFSRDLKVRTVERVNHDTKKITLELPGGDSQISGVPASGTPNPVLGQRSQNGLLTDFRHSRNSNPAHFRHLLVPYPPALYPNLFA